MTPILQERRDRLTAAWRLALAIYLALFFVWVLPAHDLLHTPASLTDRVALTQIPSHPAALGHNSDQCQLCRTHGQLDAYTVPVQGSVDLPAHSPSTGESTCEPASSLPSHLSPRSPPIAG